MIMEEERIDDGLDLAFEVFESENNITEEQLELVKRDKKLRNDLQAIHDIKAEMKHGGEDLHVEQRLRAFNVSHGMGNDAMTEEMNCEDSSRTRGSHSFIKYITVAAAAAAVLAFFLLKHGEPEAAPAGRVFTADATSREISIITNDNQEISLPVKSDVDEPVSIDDYRKLLASDAITDRITVNVPYGKTSAVVLPDSSMVYLRPGSRVSFPTSFTQTERVVRIEGQAYFKVKHDNRRPFIVLTQLAQTTVLGTEFDVNAWDGKDTEVSLVNGSVAVKALKSGDHLRLSPGQQAVVSADAVRVADIDPTPYQYWSEGYLYYENEELRTIMEDIGKNFNMTVDFQNEKAMSLRMRFITERDKGIDAVVNRMNKMKKVTVTVDAGRIIVN